MEWIQVIYYILGSIAIIASIGVPFIVKLKLTNKKLHEAETDAEFEKASADLLEYAKQLINTAEDAYSGFDKVMKTQNSTAGGMKKESVLSKLQVYALQKGYAFDTLEWSDKIDELVKFTKNVNGK